MSHPVRISPNNLHHKHYRQLNRIDEEPLLEDQTISFHSGNDSSINSNNSSANWFHTLNSNFNSNNNNHFNNSESLLDQETTIVNGDNEHSSNTINHHQQFLNNNKEVLQRKLRFYFMSPIDKWRIKRRFPFKLCFQLFKIIFVTVQIAYFGNEMSQFLNYEDNTRTAFREMLLRGWDPTREVFTYPPSSGSFAVYTSDSFYDSLNYAIHQYSNLTTQSVGAFGYNNDNNNLFTHHQSASNLIIILEKRAFRQRFIDPSKYIFNFDNFNNNEIKTDIRVINDLYPPGDSRWTTFDARQYFQSDHINFTIDFKTLISFRLRLPLRSIYFNIKEEKAKKNLDKKSNFADHHFYHHQSFKATTNTVQCYDLNVTIWYDNRKHDGKIPVTLSTERRVHECKSGQSKAEVGISG